MSLISDIQTIAKTKELEEKLAKALSQSDTTINSDVGQSSIQSERSIGIADGTTNTGTTTNNTTIVQVQGGTAGNALPIPNLGYIPAAYDPNGDPNNGNANTSLANLSGGLSAAAAAAQQVAQANGLLNQQLPTNSSQGSAIQNINSTDMSSNTANGDGGVTDSTGGSNAVMVATNGKGVNVGTGQTGDSTLNSINNSPQFNNSSASDQQNFMNQIIDNNYNSPGTVTADQLTRNAYSANYNPLQNQLNAIIGFDPNGNISTATGSLLALKVQIGPNANTFPTPTAADMKANDMAGTWTTPNSPPTYMPPSYQTGYYWTVTTDSGTTYSQTIEACLSAGQSYTQSLNPTYTYTGFRGLYKNTPFTGSPDYTLATAGNVAAANPSGVALYFVYNYLNGSSPTYVQTSGALNNCPGSDPGPGNIHNMCFTGPPGLVTAANWPKTGVAIASSVNGKLTYNPYDSEVPAYLYSSPASSVIKLAAGDGVNIINTNTVFIQPAINGGYLISVYNSGGTFQFANYYDSKGFLESPNMSQSQVKYFYP